MSEKIVLNPARREAKEGIDTCEYCGHTTCATRSGSTICEPDLYHPLSDKEVELISEEWGIPKEQLINNNNNVKK